MLFPNIEALPGRQPDTFLGNIQGNVEPAKEGPPQNASHIGRVMRVSLVKF